MISPKALAYVLTLERLRAHALVCQESNVPGGCVRAKQLGVQYGRAFQAMHDRDKRRVKPLLTEFAASIIKARAMS